MAMSAWAFMRKVRFAGLAISKRKPSYSYRSCITEHTGDHALVYMSGLGDADWTLFVK